MYPGFEGLLSNSKYRFYSRVSYICIEAPIRNLAKKFILLKELKFFLPTLEPSGSSRVSDYGELWIGIWFVSDLKTDYGGKVSPCLT